MFYLILIIMVSLLNVYGHGGVDEAKDKYVDSILNSSIPCKELSNQDLVMIGDYFMELMHPQNHKIIEKVVCNNDEACLNQIHISVAKNTYCSKFHDYGWFGGYMHDVGMMYYGMFFYPLIVLLLIVLIVVIIVIGLKDNTPKRKK